MTVEVLAPTTLAEALAVKAERPEAVPVAGGTDVMVELDARRLHPSIWLDLSRVAELRGWRTVHGWFELGAGVTYTEIVDRLSGFVPLAQAAVTVGSPQIRNRGTVGGNLGTASPAGDTLPVLAAYDAQIVLASAAVTRPVPVGEFLLGPKRTALASDELIVAVGWPAHRHVGSFSKAGPRNAMAIAVASLAVVIDEDTHRVRAALGAVGPTVLRAPDAEAFAAAAIGDAGGWDGPTGPLPDGECDEFGALVAAAAQPIDDLRGTAAYRRHACRVLGARTLRWLTAQRAATAAAA